MEQTFWNVTGLNMLGMAIQYLEQIILTWVLLDKIPGRKKEQYRPSCTYADFSLFLTMFFILLFFILDNKKGGHGFDFPCHLFGVLYEIKMR